MVRLKVTKKEDKLLALILFQFLMVRLKAVTDQGVNVTFDISIPYGAIKRYASVYCRSDREKFQFLMVRLKVIV